MGRDGTIPSEESCSKQEIQQTLQLWRQLNDADPKAAFLRARITDDAPQV